TTPTADNKAPANDTTSAPAPAAQPVAAAPAPAPAAKPADLNIIPIKRSVFFDYDKFDLKSEYTPVVEAHAKYLIANPSRKAVIQGNADERGGSEYNLALGQKRAEAERKALELLGVSTSQLEAVSFGKEKPRSSGHNEAAWADNRRADIVYK
ncbi:MAG: peptidoglycan-associated lipoprotein Pal, partial [Burkholderiaceae bacterium]